MLMSTNQIITHTSFLSVSIGALILLPTAQQDEDNAFQNTRAGREKHGNGKTFE